MTSTLGHAGAWPWEDEYKEVPVVLTRIILIADTNAASTDVGVHFLSMEDSA